MQTRVLEGLGAVGGVAVGRAVCIRTRGVEAYRIPIQPQDLVAELERLRRATLKATEELQLLESKVGAELGAELGSIFEAQGLVLSDPIFQQHVQQIIRTELVNAEWAVQETTGEFAEKFAQIEHPDFPDHGQDLWDVARNLLRALHGIDHHDLSELSGPLILVAEDITPTEAIRFGRQGVVAFATERGGRTSHTMIIAQSLDIPFVGGLAGVVAAVTQNDPVIVDGTVGKLILHPTSKVLQEYTSRAAELELDDIDLERAGALPAVSRDGVEIQLLANIDLVEEIGDAAKFGASGVGLYRSEFLYIQKSPELPSEEEQLTFYRQLIAAMAPNPVVIRTYDLGGRKLARAIASSPEENPVLGLRGIRLTLSHRKIFRDQLRALFRATQYGDLSILLPMVSNVEEIRSFRAFADQVMAELAEESLAFEKGFRLGAMIEVPSAAVAADLIAREVDFLSVGTNDLIQYALAVDRNNEHVADLYQPLHPAILRMLRFIAKSAERAGVAVSVCGEMAGDPRCVPILMGLGYRSLSVAPRRVPAVKRRIRQLSIAEMAKVADRCLELGTQSEVEQYLDRCGGWPTE